MSTPTASGPSAPVSDASLSRLAQGMIGSEVLRIAAEVRTRIAAGEPVCNLTVGDFDPREFPLPAELLAGVQAALAAGHTNYPPSNGIPELRAAVAEFYGRELGLLFGSDAVLIAGGARPLIYAAYRCTLDPGEAVVFPVPSWNNNHYAYLAGARAVPLPVAREHGFHPTAAQIAAELPGARLVALCSPSNPTGTPMRREVLTAIAAAIVEENARRATRGDRPVFLLFDQVYWATEFGDAEPLSPALLVPEVEPYTILVDAISKSLSATGLRVGWAVAHPAVTARMSDLLGHVGAWAPKAEQFATAAFLRDADAFTRARTELEQRLRARLEALHAGLARLAAQGHPVDAVKPQGTLYLSARFAWHGRSLAGGVLRSNDDIRRALLEHAGLAVVPFQAFALREEDGWFRLSVGATSVAAIEAGLGRLSALLARLG
jgi:aspartate aminotransferase